MVTRRWGGGADDQRRLLLSALLLVALMARGSRSFLLPSPAHAHAHARAQARTAAAASIRLQALRPFHPTAAESSDAMPLMDNHAVKAHGRHICLDYTGFYVDAAQGAEATLQAIRAAVGESGVREVHSRIVVLGEDGLSPPGFTGVCLVDESHVTAHCYSDRGWLAIDVFTCGAHPPEV
jgi:S-adenosylmethionine/arginine decarboxylase-like enzyme